MTTIPLSSVMADVDQITVQLQQKLVVKPVWTDLVDDATGQFVIEAISAGIAMDQHAIERLIQEISIENARMPSTLYANAANQGVRLSRKLPAGQEVLLTRSDTSTQLTIPAYTQFTSPSGQLFNRESIIFQIGEANPNTTTLDEIEAFINSGAGGSLVNGNYFYKIAGIDSTGRAHPSQIKSITLTGSLGTVMLTWEAVSTAVKYQVYGRDGVTYALIQDDIPPGTLSFQDDGSITPDSGTLFPTIPTTGTVFLYQGEVKTASTVISSSADRRFFISAESNFSVSDIDVLVSANATPIPVVQDGLWNYKGSEPAVQDRTTSKGRLNLVFGTSLYGYFPAVGDSIVILYTVTTGAEANSQTVGDTVTSVAFPDIAGISTTPLTGGANERSFADYRDAPLLFASRDRCVRSQDYNVVARLYPGVADARIYGQRDIDITNNQYMNVLRAAILPKEGVWTVNQFNDFVAYMRKIGIAGLRLIQYDPIGYDFELEVDVYAKNNTDLSGLKATVEKALRNFYARRRGILGYDSYNSDIDILIKSLSPAVDYVVIRSPKIGVITNLFSPDLILTEVPAGGFLAAGTYAYYIKAQTDGDLPLKGPYLITIAAGSAVNIHFNQVSQIITGYTLYRELSGTIKSQPIAPTTDLEPIDYLDDGGVSSFANTVSSLPTYNDGGVWYPRLSDLTVRTFFTQR